MRYKVELTIMTLGLICLSLAGVASAGGVVKTVYVDGNVLGVGTGPEPLSSPYTRLTIGAEGSAWYRYNEFAGMIDEFAVYGRVLSDANVSIHFAAGPAGYVAKVLADNPLLYLQFEDANSNNGSVALNSGSADVNGKYIDGVTLPAGYVGKAASFRGPIAGANGDCVDVPDEYKYLTRDNLTVEFWVNTTQASEYPRFFQHNNGDTVMGGYGAMYSAGSDAIGLIGGGDTDYVTVAPANLNDANWHHIVITYASTNSYAAEVMADDPCVYLKFDNSMLVDSSKNHWWVGYGMAGKIQKTAGGMGKSLYVDNSILFQTEYGPHPDAAAFTWNNWRVNPEEYPPRGPPPYSGNDDRFAFAPNDISFELWIKSVPELIPHQYAMLFQQMGAWTREPNAPGLGIDGNGVDRPSVLRVLGGNQKWYPGVNTPMDGNWHQLVVTYDEAKDGNPDAMGIELYLDGRLAGSKTTVTDSNGEAILGPELSHLVIGSENDWGFFYNSWGGYIDEFAVYKGILSAERVAAHYAAWQPINCADVWDRGLGLDGDLDRDCDVDFYDYAIFGSQWMLCDDP
ncbi:MAG: LamG domain-containing protein, partial [Sedimentisphaerales bacterium]|nr:LamG domain-containing protein [Sedimentisphaerales bacterium]